MESNKFENTADEAPGAESDDTDDSGSAAAPGSTGRTDPHDADPLGGAETSSEHEEVAVAEEQPSPEDAVIRDLAELQDRHLRLAAEFENYRKRTRRELAEMRVRSQAELVRRLLDTLDDLSRVAHTPPGAAVDSLLEGVGLVELKMRKELGDAGLARIEATGKPFDPNLHEAVATRSVHDPQEDDVVARVLVDGYTFGDILVRPARVEVKKYVPLTPESQLEEAAADQDPG